MTATIWVGVVAIGGVGAVLRFVVDRAVSGRIVRAFPVGTLAVNLSGAMALGFLFGLTQLLHRRQRQPSPTHPANGRGRGRRDRVGERV